MAKVKRSGKGSAGRKRKGRAKAEPAASMTVVASVTRTVTVVSTGPASAGAMPLAFAAESVTAGSVTADSLATHETFTATSVAVAAGLAAPATDEALFDVVCSVDAVVLSSVDFGVAQSTARKHNKAHPGHDAQPIRQQQ